MTSFNEETVSELIASIYAAAYSEGDWLHVVEEMQRLFHASKACLSRIGPDLRMYDAITTNFDEFFARKIMEMYTAQEDASLRALVEAIEAAPEGAIYSEVSRFGREFLRRSDVWNEWYLPQDMYGGLTCKLLSSGSSYWFLDIQRGRNQPAFDDKESALLAVLSPHLRRAASISRHFKATRALSLAASSLPFGIIVVNAHLRVLSTNAFADELLVRADGILAAKSGSLRVLDNRRSDQFAALVAGACGMGGFWKKRELAVTYCWKVTAGHASPFLSLHSLRPNMPAHFWSRAPRLSCVISNRNCPPDSTITRARCSSSRPARPGSRPDLCRACR